MPHRLDTKLWHLRIANKDPPVTAAQTPRPRADQHGLGQPMSSRAIVSLGVWILAMVLVGTMTVGFALLFYVALTAFFAVVVVIMMLITRQRDDDRRKLI